MNFFCKINSYFRGAAVAEYTDKEVILCGGRLGNDEEVEEVSNVVQYFFCVDHYISKCNY